MRNIESLNGMREIESAHGAATLRVHTARQHLERTWRGNIKSAHSAGEIASVWCSGAWVCSYMYITVHTNYLSIQLIVSSSN